MVPRESINFKKVLYMASCVWGRHFVSKKLQLFNLALPVTKKQHSEVFACGNLGRLTLTQQELVR